MNDLPTPMSRIECYLAVAAGMTGVTLPEAPESRLEDYLAYIAGDTSIVLPTPASLCELWLNYVATGISSDEMKLEGAFHIGAQKVDVRFFAVAGGMEGVIAPAPQNRTEQYWAKIAEIRPIHGVLKYATGTNIVLTDVVSGLNSLENIYGDTTQNGTPTPDAPVDVNVVTGTQRVYILGKNLLSLTDRTQTRISIDCGTTDGRVTINGTATRNNFGGSYWNINGTNNTNANYYNFDTNTTGTLLDAGTYTLSVHNITGSYTSPSGVFLRVTSVYAGSYPIPTLGSIELSNAATSATFTLTGPTVVKVQLQIQVSSDTSVAVPIFNNYAFDLQLESGSLVSPFEPYQAKTFVLNLGNMFDASTIVAGDIRGGNTSIRLCTHQDIYLESGTYTFSSNIQSPYQYSLGINQVGPPPLSAYPTYSYESGWVSDAKTTFTLTQAGWLSVQFRKNDNSSLTVPDIQQFNYYLNNGPTITTPIELCKIGTYQDYIYKSGDDWYVHKAINKHILDPVGDQWTSTANNVFYAIGISDYATSDNIPYCNALIGNTNVTGLSQAQAMADNHCAFINVSGATTPRFYIKSTVFNSGSDFINYITNNITSIYYALATPTDTKITDNTLIGQLNALNSAVLPKPNATITVTPTGTNLAGSLKISYMGEEE